MNPTLQSMGTQAYCKVKVGPYGGTATYAQVEVSTRVVLIIF